MTRRGGIPAHVLWPGIVIALLGTSLLACGITVYVAISDPSFSVEEDYYDRAVRWDEKAEQLRANERLGWKAQATLGADVSQFGERDFRITLTDAQGDVIDGAQVFAEVFHRARSGDRLNLQLESIGNGVYTARGKLGRAGFWQVRGLARRSADLFTFEHAVLTPEGGDR